MTNAHTIVFLGGGLGRWAWGARDTDHATAADISETLGWAFRILDTAHQPMFINPVATAHVIEELARL